MTDFNLSAWALRNRGLPGSGAGRAFSAAKSVRGVPQAEPTHTRSPGRISSMACAADTVFTTSAG